jgi:glycosyltransferase involved in cell wall biosynthesis
MSTVAPPPNIGDIWVVIPAQNEAASIAGVVRRAKLYAEHVVVVDDASTDETASLARAAGAEVLPLVTPLDAWCATQTGLRFARARGACLAVSLDADGQHPPEAIPALVKPVLEGRADVSIGSDPARVSHYRHIAWGYLRAITGLSAADLTSGFRVYGRRALEILVRPEASSLNYQDVGVLMMLREEELSMTEVPVTMGPRLFGASHVFRSWVKVAAYMLESSVIGLARRSRA